jgi:hypothetical protein
MTDGAPSHYNGNNKGGNNARDDRLPDNTNASYKKANNYDDSQDIWYGYFSTNHNTYGQALYNEVGGNMFAIGFDLEYQWYWNSKKSTDGGTPISGATENAYTFTDSDTAPFYYCKITHHDIDKDIVIYSNIITKDSTPADFTAYNEAVKAAQAVDRSLYKNIEILDEALAVDVYGKFSCEQDFVDAQTKAIYDAIAALRHNGVETIIISAAEIQCKPFELLPLNYMIYPEDAIYDGITWSCEQNKDVVLLNKNGYVRIIGYGQAVIKGEITNPDGEVISATTTINIEMSALDKFVSTIFKPFWILIYAMSGQRID